MSLNMYLRHWLWFIIGDWAKLFKRPDVSLAYWRRIMSENPNNSRVQSFVAHTVAESGNKQEALQEFDRLIAINANDAFPHYNKAFILQELKQHEAAVAEFKLATTNNERLDVAWYGMGMSLLELKRKEEALECFLTNSKLQAMSPYGHYQVAKLYFELGELEKCEKRMLKLKGFEPRIAAKLEDETGINIGVDRWWVK
jgi:tetratricopeptide (TPR) repeat protein